MTPAQFFGWAIGGASAAALMNFLLKQVSREYVKTISKRNPDFARSYRTFMQFMVRNHRYFGLAAVILFLVHAGAVLLSGISSLTGIAAGILLLSATGIGLYGFHVKKNPRGRWIHLHRGAALLFALAVIVHKFFKAVILL